HPDHRHKDPEKERRMGIYHYNEGNRFLKKGDWKEAVRNYKMALHHDKTLHPVYINMSNAYLKGEQYPEALKTLQALQAQAPRQPELHYNFACYYSLTHQEKAALESLKKAVSLGYSKPDDFQSDPDLENLRRTADFAEWLAKL
ncbi:MAG: tetratricopeptide repeat protein, partial [Nitrospinaceae bacterium]|nr:tetratricopeptide repeat protein [Nitrospinaceae bacterium]NIR56748.1 tetratricopeptide repeat protein [Nitrospinaceae bacterium]NIS87197.1 tetratricopeptide repeat protein [Nitrospinaceae bacterium]NIT84066.1 tetratricopeptide repeat protein [Nitrospinaceae bacterium]NIU46249.1 tetratricopeptide repeat protein [Nitrospinaceae bacterium]